MMTTILNQNKACCYVFYCCFMVMLRVLILTQLLLLSKHYKIAMVVLMILAVTAIRVKSECMLTYLLGFLLSAPMPSMPIASEIGKHSRQQSLLTAPCC